MDRAAEIPDGDGLLRRARAGDQAAFRALVEATHGDLHAFVASRAWDPALSEEVVQDAYVILFEQIGRVFDAAALLPWLKGVARHRLHEHWRERRLRARHRADPLAELVAAQAERIEDPGETEAAPRLRACLDRLSAPARELLDRHHLQGRSVAELAGELGVAVGVVAMRLCRIRAALRACLRHGGAADHA